MTDEPDLTALRQGPLPPDDLEARVLSAARSSGLVRVSTWRAHLVRVAASVALLLAGAAAGRMLWPAPAGSEGAQATTRYLFLLAGDVAPAPDGDTRASEYGAWARGVAARGIAVDGEELTEAASVIGTRGSAFPELSAVGGYFLIEARDDAAAAELARSCPHVKYGGSVIIRKVVSPTRQ